MQGNYDNYFPRRLNTVQFFYLTSTFASSTIGDMSEANLDTQITNPPIPVKPRLRPGTVGEYASRTLGSILKPREALEVLAENVQTVEKSLINSDGKPIGSRITTTIHTQEGLPGAIELTQSAGEASTDASNSSQKLYMDTLKNQQLRTKLANKVHGLRRRTSTNSGDSGDLTLTGSMSGVEESVSLKVSNACIAEVYLIIEPNSVDYILDIANVNNSYTSDGEFYNDVIGVEEQRPKLTPYDSSGRKTRVYDMYNGARYSLQASGYKQPLEVLMLTSYFRESNATGVQLITQLATQQGILVVDMYGEPILVPGQE